MSYQSGAETNLGALSSEEEVKGKGRNKTKKKTTRKVVDRQILLAGLFAIIVVIGTVLFLNRPEGGTFVVRAAAPIAALSPITLDLLEVVKVPDIDVVEGSFNAPSEAEAVTLAQETFTGISRATSIINLRQQITTSDISGIDGLTTPLQNGERLLSVSADVVSGVAGQIKPGDVVDVFATADGGDGNVTGLLASNVPVVSVSVSEDLYRQAQSQQQEADAAGTSPGNLLPTQPVAPGIYVLRVSDEVVPGLVASQVSGKLFFVYRSPGIEGEEAIDDIVTEPLTAIEAVCAASPGNVSSACTTIGDGFTN